MESARTLGARATGAAIALSMFALILGACSGEEGAAPTERLSGAAAAIDEASTSRITIDAGAATTDYEFNGLIDLAEGGFDIRLASGSERAPDPRTGPFGSRKRLLAEDGHPSVFDVIRTPDRGSRAGKPCWYSNPSPTKVEGGIAVEEGARLIGSVVESLRSEIASATEVRAGTYEVELERSAARSRGNRSHEQRTWGSRELLRQLDGPISVALEDGRISSIELDLEDYLPAYGPGRVRVPADDRRSRGDVSLRAELEPTDEELRLRDPNCRLLR